MKRCWAEVDLGALDRNIGALRGVLCAGSEILFVVKAEAYGHGLLPVARRARAAGVRWFAVIALDRALALRRALPEAGILLLGVADPADVKCLAARRILPVLADADHVRELARAAAAARLRLDAHLKVDTGMGRLGVPWQEAEELLARWPEAFRLTGICSHFARVASGMDPAAGIQAARFLSIAKSAEARFGRRLMKHISSSRAVPYRRDWDADGVRAGLLLYGYGAFDAEGRKPAEPLLQWKARVVHVKRLEAGAPVGYDGAGRVSRDTVLGIVNAGYSDGYPRLLGGRAHILVGGRRRRVLGRVSMNWIAIDLDRDGERWRGAEAVLLGRQGPEAVWADELARLARTIPYEILTGIHPRVPRRYTGNP